MIVLRNRYIPFPGYNAINLLGVLVVHPGVRLTRKLLNHELIHTAQMRELGYLPFYLLYLVEWMVRLTMRGNAYASVSFEREAYAHQGEPDYLKHRRHYAWRGYLCKKNNKQK